MQHNYDQHKKNEYWTEAVKICENLVGTARDNTIVTKAISILVLLYRNFGETDKAISYANRMPELTHCREIMLASATDGKEEAKYIGDALLKMVRAFKEQLVYGLVNNSHHYESDMPIKKIKSLISVFYLVCDDGNLGKYHGDLIQLYLYLSRLQWERGYHDDAFISLDEALKHARALDALGDGQEHYFTAPLVSFVKYKIDADEKITENLPDDWPFWCNPSGNLDQTLIKEKIYKNVAGEIKPEFMILTEAEEQQLFKIFSSESTMLADLYEQLFTCACRIMYVHAPKSVDEQIDRIIFQTLFFQTVGLIGNCAVKSGALPLPDFDGPAAMYIRENTEAAKAAVNQKVLNL